jgi:GAF domain-containing protein
MSARTTDTSFDRRRRAEPGVFGAARKGPEAIPARVMAAASELFSGQSDTPQLLTAAADALSAEPGPVCLVSVADTGGDLLPLAIAHADPTASRALQSILARSRSAPADAFSCMVARTGGSLRVAISIPWLLELWLPAAYLAYAKRTQISNVLAAALVRQGTVQGTLLLWREHGQPAFSEADEAYVTGLAARLALAP